MEDTDHCSDVTFLVVFHKAHVQGMPHLDILWINPRIVNRTTRAVLSTIELVEVRRSNFSHHRRTFVNRVSRLFYTFIAASLSATTFYTQEGKLAAHRW